MKNFLPLALCLLLPACASTPETRIAQHPALFDSLSVVEQARVRAGSVQPGFTPDMVRLALGEPDRSLTRLTPSGQTLVWLYSSPMTRPLRQRVFFDAPAPARPPNGAWITLQQPDPIPRARVEFVNGLVTLVETQNPSP